MTILQKQIIYLLQKEGKMSRKKLGKLLGVTPAAMSQNIKIMMDDNIIISDEEIDLKKVGRKEVLLRLNEKRFFFLGIELSPEIYVVRSNLDGECESYSDYSNLEELKQSLKGKDFSNCLAISLSKKGFYSESNLNSEEKDLLVFLRKLCPEVYFNNNIACLAYSYKYYHDDATSFALIKYGPGLGSALFIENNLLKNDRYPTYELGQLEINLNGDTLEERVSYSSLDIDSSNVVETFENNDELRESVLSQLAVSIKTLNTLLQLDYVIVSGEIFRSNKVKESLYNILKKSGKFDLEKLSYIENYKVFNKNKSVVSGLYLFLKK